MTYFDLFSLLVVLTVAALPAASFLWEDGLKSTSGEARSSESEFTITGFEDRDLAEDYAALLVPAYDGTLILERIELEEEGPSFWRGKAFYVRDEGIGGGVGGGAPPTKKETFVAVDISETTSNVTHGEDIQQYDLTPANPGPDFQGAINVDEKGKIAGETIFLSETSFSVTVEFPTTDLTNDFFKAIEALASPPHQNDAPFRGRAAGEVLFLGATANVDLEKPTNDVVYKYKVSKNLTAGQVGPFAGVDKLGWDLAWVYSETQEISGRTVVQPIALYIVRVYETGDLGTVGVDA